MSTQCGFQPKTTTRIQHFDTRAFDSLSLTIDSIVDMGGRLDAHEIRIGRRKNHQCASGRTN